MKKYSWEENDRKKLLAAERFRRCVKRRRYNQSRKIQNNENRKSENEAKIAEQKGTRIDLPEGSRSETSHPLMRLTG